MSNKTQLQTNNTNLDALITRVNAAKDTAASLPEAGGGGGSTESGVETYTLVVESEDDVKIGGMDYVLYIDGQYQYHSDYLAAVSYPLTIHNVVLKTPMRIHNFVGGANPICALISEINYVKFTDYTANVVLPFNESWALLPLETANGQIIIRCYDDN